MVSKNKRRKSNPKKDLPEGWKEERKVINGRVVVSYTFPKEYVTAFANKLADEMRPTMEVMDRVVAINMAMIPYVGPEGYVGPKSLDCELAEAERELRRLDKYR